jgi:enoyl-CoA hydratase
MSEYSFETLTVEVEDHVAEVALNRPEVGNAMSPLMFKELGDVFTALDTDDAVRAVLLRGNGKHFTYGLDLQAAMVDLGPHMAGGLAGPRTALRQMIRDLQDQCSGPGRCRKPVVAIIHGWCIGGGIDLTSWCDVRICSQDARFSVREARIGIVADLGSLQRLPKIIGDAATRELALTAKDITAERALRLGLVSDITEPGDALLERGRQEARSIAALPPLVVQGVKHILEWQDGKSVSDSLDYVATWNAAYLASEDLGEAVAAFFSKRPPEYKGR